jgi:tRNA threonylcarbamoyladenosine biosynthesis protein TsaB
MNILTIRTDKPDAEIGLYNDHTQVAYQVWHAHRELSVTLLQKIDELLTAQQMSLAQLEGIVAYAGPGSFTGLRIGLTVANTLAYGLQLPIVGIVGEDEWIAQGIQRLLAGEHATIALPEYGAPVHITQQRK